MRLIPPLCLRSLERKQSLLLRTAMTTPACNPVIRLMPVLQRKGRKRSNKLLVRKINEH